MSEITKINGIFNGKKFYSKRLLVDEYVDSIHNLLVAIIENNENDKVVLRQKKIELFKQFKNLNTENKEQ